MASKQLNLGILARVDAGKTTLTERLLYAAGSIDRIGSVDAGTTQTDSLDLERQRGITIRSAVASFDVGDVHVNVIDTPGHPDFIAEVERVLGVLDGAVLVLSAVEGVQPQTTILMRTLQRLHIPTLLFVNKIDRAGADDARVVRAVAYRLTPAAVAMGSARNAGSRDASYAAFPLDRLTEVLAERDEDILRSFVEGTAVAPEGLRSALAAQTQRAVIHPVFAGSAITGAGVDALAAGIVELLPLAPGDPAGALDATVFKIERGPSGEKVAYVRMRSGTLRTRDRVPFGDGHDARVTALAVFEHPHAVTRPSVAAGQVAKVWGLAEIRVGDGIGEAGRTGARHFPPPTLESVVVPLEPSDRARLRVALGRLAEQDPLIEARQAETGGELSVSLYGEVQKEVIEATLAADYGLAVSFTETTPLYVERPVGCGEAVELLHAATNPYNATLGFRVEPAEPDTGIALRLEVGHADVPLYLYGTIDRFAESMDGYVRDALRTGRYGWRVTDCVVTLTVCHYSLADGPPSRRGPLSTAGDFRKLTPLVVAQALELAATTVCEPVVRARLEVPVSSVGAVSSAVARLGGSVDAPALEHHAATMETALPATRAQDLQRQIAGLTGGEGTLETTFVGYQPVPGEQPRRA